MYEEQVKSLGKKLQDSERKEGEFEIVRVQFVEDVSYLDFQNFSLLQIEVPTCLSCRFSVWDLVIFPNLKYVLVYVLIGFLAIYWQSEKLNGELASKIQKILDLETALLAETRISQELKCQLDLQVVSIFDDELVTITLIIISSPQL